MDNLYARSVFFIKDGPRSLDYYTQTLGFALDWKHEEGAGARAFGGGDDPVTVRIRTEGEADRAAIHGVNRAAFGTLVEANLVDVLRRNAPQFVSLVADVDDAIVGHIVFSKVWLAGRDDLSIMGLGPMAVAPDYQRRGIGSALVRGGLTSCKQLGCQAVVVLGHAEYYPRFGFAPAVRHAIRCEYDVPHDVFMVVELEAGALRGASGVVRYDEAFAAVPAKISL